MRLDLILLVAVFCLQPVSSATAQDDLPGDDTLVIGLTHAAYYDLDPARTSTSVDIRLLRGLYETLVVLGDDGYTIEPGAAESWEVSEDGLVYTFHLRADARWSNGRAVTAQDFAAGWFRSLIPDTEGDYAALHHVIDGATEFAQWRNEYIDATIDAGGAQHHRRTLDAWEQAKAWYLESVAVEAVDARTLRVILAWPCPYFLHLVTMPNFAPFPADRLDRNLSGYLAGTTRVREEYFADPDWVLTIGPYRLASAEETRIELVVNEHHRMAEDVGFPTIIFCAFRNESDLMRAYEAGDVDWIPSLAVPESYDALLEQGRADVHVHSHVGTYYYQFNCRPEVHGQPNPFADPALRRALAHTFDREALSELLGPSTKPLLTFVPPDSMPGYDPPAEAAAPYDMDEARRLLAAAGYDEANAIGPVEVLANAVASDVSGGNALIARWVANQWSGLEIGAAPEVCLPEFMVYLNRSKAGAFHVRRAGWYGDYADPTTFLDMLRSDDANNDAGYASEAFNGLMADAEQERDPARRSAILREAEAMLLRDAVVVPLYQYGAVTLYDAERLHMPLNAWMSMRLEHIRRVGE